MKILAFGEILWDIYPNERCLGGAPLNFAAHAQRSGAESFLLSAIGRDEEGVTAREELKRLKVHECFVATLPEKPTGKCVVTLQENGLPIYHLLENVAYDAIPFHEKLKEGNYDALSFGTLALRGRENRHVLKKILQLGICKTIYCDLNLRAPFYDKKLVESILPVCNILKMSEEELDIVSDFLKIPFSEREEKVKEIAIRFPNLQVLIITLGEKGAFAYEGFFERFTYCEAVKTEVV